MFEKDLVRRLRGLDRPRPGPELMERLVRETPPAERPARKSVWAPVLRPAAALAAIALVFLAVQLFSHTAVSTSWAETLRAVSAATGAARGVHLEMRARTSPREDFSFVALDRDLAPVEIWVDWPNREAATGRVRMTKPGMVYAFDGKETTVYRPGFREAFRAPGDRPRFEFFWPAAWLEELAAIPGSPEVLAREESGARGRLLLHWPGAPVSGREPAFFNEFDREVEITWDTATRRLTGFTRWVERDGERILFSELEAIEYDPVTPAGIFTVDLPPDVRSVRVGPASPELNALGPREAAARLWNAAVAGDWETVAALCPSPATVDYLRARRPVEVLSIGVPFRTGSYAGVYVPYAIRFARSGAAGGDAGGTRAGEESGRAVENGSGEVRRYNLALRNDNEFGRWVADGGI